MRNKSTFNKLAKILGFCAYFWMIIFFSIYYSANAASANNGFKKNILETDCSYTINGQDFEKWTKPANSYLISTDSGYIYLSRMLESYERESRESVVYYLDKDFHCNKRIVIPNELPIWGGFCSDGEYYYVFTGQENHSESDTLEVMRITKYDSDFNRIDACAIKNVNVYEPYAFSGVTVAFKDSHMIMQTGRTMYKSSKDGKNHQKMLTLEINTDTMEREDTGIDYGWVSHSLYQNVKIDGDKVVSVEMGDAYPRGWLLLETPNSFNESNSGSTQITTLMSIPEYGYEYQNIHASIGGFEISRNNYIVAGNSLLHDEKRLERNTRNIYVAVCEKDTKNVTLKQITYYDEGEESASVPQLVKISNERFMLLWNHNGEVNYTLLDGNGNTTGKIFKLEGYLSDCQPIVSGGKVIWASAFGTELSFYTVKTSDPGRFSIKKTIVGHQFVVEKANKSKVDFKCEICGITATIKHGDETEYEDFSVAYHLDKFSLFGYPLPEEYHIDVGQALEIWIDFDYEFNHDFVFENDSPTIVKTQFVKEDDEGTRLYMFWTGLKDGVSNITVKQPWWPAYAKTYKIIVGTGVEKKQNKYTIKVSKSTIKYSELKKKAVNVKINVQGGKGKVSFKNVSSKKLKKYIKISDDGTVTISKKAKKGTYKIKVTAKASGDYKKTVKTVKITVK